jgi:hypothetical protein
MQVHYRTWVILIAMCTGFLLGAVNHIFSFLKCSAGLPLRVKVAVRQVFVAPKAL